MAGKDKFFGLILIPIFLGGFLCVWAQGIPFFHCVKTFSRIIVPSTDLTTDATVELEVSLAPGLIRILTTKDGTVGPLLQGVEIPQWLRLRLRPGMTDPMKILWDELGEKDKVDLLKHVGKQTALAMKKDRKHEHSTLEELSVAAFKYPGGRKIPGLKVRNEIEITVPGGTEYSILGKTYGPGKHLLRLAQNFKDVEWGSESDRANLELMELHFRGYGSKGIGAGEVASSASNLMRALHLSSAQHVHVVSLVPKTSCIPEDDPAVREKLLLGLMLKLVHEANMVAGLFVVMESEAPQFGRISESGAREFDYLSGIEMSGMVLDFQRMIRGESSSFRDTYKMGAAGVRGPGEYRWTNADGLLRWGLEVRSLDEYAYQNPEGHQSVRKFLDMIQYKMEALSKPGPYPFKDELDQVRRWVAARPEGMDFRKYVEMSWYNREMNDHELFNTKSASRQVLEALTPAIKKILAESTARVTDEEGMVFKPNLQLKMLVHNWRNSPIFFRSSDSKFNQEKILRVEREQVKALQALEKAARQNEITYGQRMVYDDDILKICRNFLRDSGLYEESILSMGPQ